MQTYLHTYYVCGHTLFACTYTDIDINTSLLKKYLLVSVLVQRFKTSVYHRIIKEAFKNGDDKNQSFNTKKKHKAPHMKQ